MSELNEWGLLQSSLALVSTGELTRKGTHSLSITKVYLRFSVYPPGVRRPVNQPDNLPITTVIGFLRQSEKGR